MHKLKNENVTKEFMSMVSVILPPTLTEAQTVISFLYNLPNIICLYIFFKNDIILNT